MKLSLEIRTVRLTNPLSLHTTHSIAITHLNDRWNRQRQTSVRAAPRAGRPLAQGVRAGLQLRRVHAGFGLERPQYPYLEPHYGTCRSRPLVVPCELFVHVVTCGTSGARAAGSARPLVSDSVARVGPHGASWSSKHGRRQDGGLLRHQDRSHCNGVSRYMNLSFRIK